MVKLIKAKRVNGNLRVSAKEYRQDGKSLFTADEASNIIIGMNTAMNSIGKERWTARFNFNELIIRGVN